MPVSLSRHFIQLIGIKTASVSQAKNERHDWMSEHNLHSEYKGLNY